MSFVCNAFNLYVLQFFEQNQLFHKTNGEKSKPPGFQCLWQHVSSIPSPFLQWQHQAPEKKVQNKFHRHLTFKSTTYETTHYLLLVVYYILKSFHPPIIPAGPLHDDLLHPTHADLPNQNQNIKKTFNTTAPPKRSKLSIKFRNKKKIEKKKIITLNSIHRSISQKYHNFSKYFVSRKHHPNKS